MLDFIRIACAVPPVQVADVKKNAADICRYIQKAEEAGADIVLFPELALTGYNCEDLFFQDALLQAAKEGLRTVAEYTAKVPAITAVLGLPLCIGTGLYNCAAVVTRGEVVGIVPKTHIPNHNEFSEKRWFVSGKDINKTYLDPKSIGLCTGHEHRPIPFGVKQLFGLGTEAVVGIEICEDGLVPQPVSAELAVSGAEVILNLSASNASVGKSAFRRKLVEYQSGMCNCVYAYVSAGCTESTADMVFCGQSLIAENGRLLAENGYQKQTDYLLLCDCDLGKIRADRRKNQNYSAANSVGAVVENANTGTLRSDGSLYPLKKRPFVPEEPKKCLERCKEVFQMQTAGLKHRLQTVGGKAVIGISGGLDSTLAVLVSVEAMKQLGRPASDVHCITMPCFGTSARTYENAVALMEGLGVTRLEIPVRDAVMQHFLDIGHDPEAHNTTYENAQARERTQVLMDYAGMVGGIVVGTGDLSELALGWCTYNGDQMSMYGVNCGVPKTLILEMVNALAKEPDFHQVRTVLQDIAATPISPELLPPDGEGSACQKTEELVGPYELHDFFLYYMLRFGFGPEKIYTLACRAFAGEQDRQSVKKWLVTFYKRFFSQQFKRSTMPEGIRVGQVCLNPRGDWQMPGDLTGKLWIETAQALQ